MIPVPRDHRHVISWQVSTVLGYYGDLHKYVCGGSLGMKLACEATESVACVFGGKTG